MGRILCSQREGKLERSKMDKKVVTTYYHGTRTVMNSAGTVTVEVIYDDYSRDVYPLDPRYDLRSHSLDGFNWGYGGSGPAQLALAMCAHALGARDDAGDSDEVALSVYQDFKWKMIGRIKEASFVLTSDDVIDVIDAILKERNKASAGV